MIETTITGAEKHFDRMCEAAAQGETIIIKRTNGEDVALISASELSSLRETMHLIQSPANALRLFSALERIEQQAIRRGPAPGE